jgi:hypothetical protein
MWVMLVSFLVMRSRGVWGVAMFVTCRDGFLFGETKGERWGGYKSRSIV